MFGGRAMRSEQPQALHAIILGVATAVIGYALYELLPVTGFWLISTPWEGLKNFKDRLQSIVTHRPHLWERRFYYIANSW